MGEEHFNKKLVISLIDVVKYFYNNIFKNYSIKYLF